MSELKLSQEPKLKPRPPRLSSKRSLHKDDDLIDLFPLPRYFQIHFQHIHDKADNIQNELTQLKQHVAAVDAKLDHLLALLGNAN